MAQSYNPVPLDALPIPQVQTPQYQPAQLQPPPTDQPPGAGAMGNAGKAADIASNFLQGWLVGKQKAEAKKLEMARQSVEGAQYAFSIAQQNAQTVNDDPKATPEQKQKAEQARQQAWKAYLGVAEQYTTPDKKSGKKKGGVGGAFQGIGEHLKNTFGTEDPHIFAQSTMALLKTTGPPPLQAKSSQEQLADLQYSGAKRLNDAIDALADARQKNAPPDQIAKLEQNVRDLQGQIQTPEEQNKNALAQAAMDERAGKPVSEATKKQLQAAGYDPAPVMPGMFQRIAPDGTMYIDSVNPETGALIGSTKVGKTRVPPDQRAEAQQIFRDNLNNLGTLLKQAHPDWTDQQISQAKADAMLSGEFKVKVAPNLSPAQTQAAVSKAVGEVVNSMLDPDERKEVGAIVVHPTAATYMLRTDLASTGFWDRMGFVGPKEYYGMSKDQANALDAKVRSLTRRVLERQGYSQEQIDAMVPQTMADARSTMGLEPPPGGEDSGKTATKEDVQAFAQANNMSYKDAVKAVEDQGYSVEGEK